MKILYKTSIKTWNVTNVHWISFTSNYLHCSVIKRNKSLRITTFRHCLNRIFQISLRSTNCRNQISIVVWCIYLSSDVIYNLVNLRHFSKNNFVMLWAWHFTWITIRIFQGNDLKHLINKLFHKLKNGKRQLKQYLMSLINLVQYFVINP